MYSFIRVCCCIRRRPETLIWKKWTVQLGRLVTWIALRDAFPYLSFINLAWAAHGAPLLLRRTSVLEPLSIVQKRPAGELYGSIWWSVPTVSLPSPLSDGPGPRCVKSAKRHCFYCCAFSVFGFSWTLKWTLLEVLHSVVFIVVRAQIIGWKIRIFFVVNNNFLMFDS